MRYVVYFTADDYVSIGADTHKFTGDAWEFYKDAALVAVFRSSAILGWEVKDK